MIKRMKNIVFFFTGTGNSYKAARDICQSLPSCEIAPMTEIFKLNGEYDRIGFVYPAYGYSMPNMVEHFIKKTDFSAQKSAYFFSVVTCGGNSRNALYDVDKILKKQGLQLNYGKQIVMFDNYINLYAIDDDSSEKTKKSNGEILIACEDINKKKQTKKYKNSFTFTVVHKAFNAALPKLDKNYNVSSDCNACGLCVKLCPAKNIEMKDEKLEFLHKCEQCVACIHWCPKKAINYKSKTQNRSRYHHPEVRSKELSDLLNLNKGE